MAGKNLREFVQYLRQQLQQVYDEQEAASIAQLVAEHLLGLNRLQLSLQWQERVKEDIVKQAEDQILPRLLQQEPVQYVLESAHFYGLDFLVKPGVLIPRPETEELVALIVRENKHLSKLKILDVGTGSGCIALALAHELPQAEVLAIDVSADALQIAKTNSESLGLPVKFMQHDIFTDFPEIVPKTLDVLVSNPPYVLESEKSLMKPNVLEYEPHLALFVEDKDALIYYIRIAELGKEWLKPGGKLYFEINEQFGKATVQMLEKLDYQLVEVLQDIQGRDRMVRAQL